MSTTIPQGQHVVLPTAGLVPVVVGNLTIWVTPNVPFHISITENDGTTSGSGSIVIRIGTVAG